MNHVPPNDDLARLVDMVRTVHPKPGHGLLIQALSDALPDLEVKLACTRSGWHRPGGVVDADGNRVAESLARWIESQAGEDPIDLFMKYQGSGLLATRLCGTTHYITAQTGAGPWDFIQIEVDELREITDRELFDADGLPDAVDDLLDPDMVVHVDPTPLGPAFYQLRQAFDVADAHGRMTEASYAENLLVLRFIDDWMASSASANTLSKHFVLKFTDYKDRFGDKRLQATPLSTHGQALPPLPGGADRGVELAKYLGAFDRAVGHPMAWFFHMVSATEPGLKGIAHAVHEDVSGAYDYLPERDVAVLAAWVDAPYTF